MASTQEEGDVKVKRSAAPSFSITQSCAPQYAQKGAQTARVPIFKLLVTGLLLFDLVMTLEIVSHIHEPKPSDDNEEVCSPRLTTDLPPPPTFHGDHTTLCYEQARVAAQYRYCLPISGRKDTPLCASADRMDLLQRDSSKPTCYASVLHMLLVEVYEELQATGNTPFLTFGSLLGAVRNGSMIPFTEDADVGFVGEMKSADAVILALRRKGYHMFFMDIWRVCVAPTHPLAGSLYDPNLPITKNFAVPYLDLYMMKGTADGDWDLEELEGTIGSILPGDKVLPFSQVPINGMQFDTVNDPKFFLKEAYGDDYMTPTPRKVFLKEK